ncbi:MAG: hypothetical protein WBG50_05995 [Desulfomonilaceae bacterium]
MSFRHYLGVLIEENDSRKLREHAASLREGVEKAVAFYAAQLPEPVEAPRPPCIAGLEVTFSQPDFLRLKALGTGINERLLEACKKYAEDPGKFIVEGVLQVKTLLLDTQTVRYRWRVRADLIQDLLPKDGYEQACFVRAALKRYVNEHCAHIPARPFHRRRSFWLELRKTDLDRLIGLGGCADLHVEQALITFLGRRKRDDRLSPLEGRLREDERPLPRIAIAIPETLYSGVGGDLGDFEDTVRAALKAYLPAAELAKAEVA